MTKKKHLTQRQHDRIAKNEQRRLQRNAKKGAVDWDEQLLLAPEPGLVLSRFGQHADVEDAQGKVIRCSMRRTISSVVTGDTVIWRRSTQATGSIDGVIEAVEERRSVLLRPDFYDGLKPVAANIDLMIIVSAILPALSFNIIDRYLVAAEMTGIKPLLVINKADLLDETAQAELEQQLALYRQLNYTCLLLSANSGQGMSTLQEYIHSGTSIFVGQSGVGKSSLMNALMPGLAAVTREVSTLSGLGQHTTTVSRLYHLPEGGELIDSPGIREFALWHLSPEEVTQGFIEFRPWLGRCKFRDCKHITDPGCAIQHAVAENAISQERYDSYLKILTSMTQDKPNHF
ncbi:small ribosomal subunit biogenesis GTPase RsgA [Alishewanella sp. 16-MA]|uniref:Small ribosomal subunit biogenesis GTPase RsgA n=1 Tax=Alishewanella maricola TaxID=2795740 RepID=A0ABS8BZB8_9ALTE|nr:small ribosomal subunit biogenesis GTPase RsgA [Alishewanella sp. SMS8]MCB5225409.1 small ribosomal subunit biogenesis GTPase RsgA [Alishewanella maricola]MDP4946435.1 small ribosomal subunit biogenesis GTPase RsgA [Alishewanella sp.]MDP5036809.1 small ribosomal subunit biogenesis GTPase RsgA [Alishewanella sp.]MDP5188124.1 small ribosomal subunit biogenesis GTPase RsgA [Alishewanella sp.]MDP5458701.1 small ribosomal subunit biogenesis GTPase RsgA [Alishewanella sp. SMS8]